MTSRISNLLLDFHIVQTWMVLELYDRILEVW